ncbi:MAG: hypothetical protein IKR11_08525, partial [Solobacterium sp.]|nr:hypothetical protein [Solobacterium sp.]
MGKNKSDDSFIRELDKAVVMARQNVQWRKEYMNLQEKMYLSKKEGMEEGKEIGRDEERLNGIYDTYNTLLRFTSVENALKAVAEQYNISEEEVKEVISGHEEKVKDPDD